MDLKQGGRLYRAQSQAFPETYHFFSTRDRSQLYYAFYLLTYFVAWAFVFHLPVEFFNYRNISQHKLSRRKPEGVATTV